MFASVILSLLLLVFWRAVLQTRPAIGLGSGTTVAMGVVASPPMFPATQQQEMANMPSQQFAHYPPQQQQQQPNGFVAPQATGGGFAQM